MHIRLRQTMWVILVPPPTTYIPSLTKIGHCVLIREQSDIHPSVHTDSVIQMKTKWSFQHSWWPTKSFLNQGGCQSYVPRSNDLSLLQDQGKLAALLMQFLLWGFTILPTQASLLSHPRMMTSRYPFFPTRVGRNKVGENSCSGNNIWAGHQGWRFFSLIFKEKIKKIRFIWFKSHFFLI